MDEDELMVQWFELINAKNDLVRKEAELMYRQRQQELEVLHEELEYELRCLMEKPGETPPLRWPIPPGKFSQLSARRVVRTGTGSPVLCHLVS